MTTISGAGAHAGAAQLADRFPTSRGGTKGYVTVEQVKQGIDPLIAHTTVAGLKAVDAAADCHDGEKRFVYGFTTFGDIDKPFIVQWDADATDTDDELLVFRPSTGAASSGAGRWIRPNPDQTVKFGNADSTPSVKNRTFFKTADSSPSINAFDDGYKGQQIVIERGAIDAVIANNSNIDCGGRSLRLTASFPRAQFVKGDDGVWRLLTPRETRISVKEFGAVGNGRVYRGAAITSGTAVLVCAGATFTAADVGLDIWVEYGAGGGAPLKTTVAAFTNSTTVTLAANAATTLASSIAIVKIGTDDTAAIDAAIAALNPKGQRLWFPTGTYLYSGASGIVIGNGDTAGPSTTQNIELVGESGGTFGLLQNDANGTAIEYIGSTVATTMLDVNGPARISVQNIVFNGTRRVTKILNLDHVFAGHFHFVGALYPAPNGIGIYQGAVATDPLKTFIGSGGNVFNQCWVSTVGAGPCVAMQIGQDAFVAGMDPATSRYNYCSFSVSDDTAATSWTANNRVATATTSTCILLRFCDNISFDGCFTFVSGQRRGNGILIKPPSGSGNASVFPTQVRFQGCAHVGGIYLDETDNTWTGPSTGYPGIIMLAAAYGDANAPTYDGQVGYPNIVGVDGFGDDGVPFGAVERLNRSRYYIVISATTTAQPASPTAEDLYIIPASATGAAWATYTAGNLAQYRNGQWRQITRDEGACAYVKDTDRVLFYNGTAWGARAPTVQVFTTTGANTWTRPAGCVAVVVEVRAGGGGGGGVSNASGSLGGGGGGQGGRSIKRIAVASLGTTETVTVGAGGAGGADSGGAGSNGGVSSFGSHCSATAGQGANGATATGMVAGNSGGVGSSGDLNFTGQGGLGSVAITGTGVASGLGGGEGGGRGRSTTGAGNAGSRGGGGGGAASAGGVTGNIGGAGGDGWVMVTEFY